ncbi:hypothetical protein LCGC14_2682820 [marine sediment metagenome]|uniref:Uncharacterized protein n=1 Tax=marine sediment metagenome TaxID=412755 RepID=A0A0F8ZKX0_9ZZZZ
MPESEQHRILKYKARDQFLGQGYSLLSLDREVVEGYRPDIILENEDEVLFVEIVATSDHELKNDLMYHGKPVRFVKYYTLDSWLKSYYRGLRKSPIKIMEDIFEALPTDGTISTKQLAKRIGSTWRTTEAYLRLIVWVQSCPKIISERAGKRIKTYRREWGNLPE